MDTAQRKMCVNDRDDAGSDGEEEEEDSDAKIERLMTEIDELKASLIGVPELSGEWYQIKTDIKERDVERLVLLEKKRCDDVVKEYFEENPHVLEAVPDCPICLEKMWLSLASVRYVCCGKQVCKKCDSKGGRALNICPLCRGEAPNAGGEIILIKEKADSGIAWAQEEMGKRFLIGNHDVPKDVEKALSLFSEAAEKGSTRAKCLLGSYYARIGKYEEARQWHEAAAAEGEIYSLFQLGVLMNNGRVCDRNEETRAEAFRLITVSATLSQGLFNWAAVEYSRFFHDSLPVLLHYLRPVVEEGNTSGGLMEAMDSYALGIFTVAIQYYGENVLLAPGYSPVPKALFWHRRVGAKGFQHVKKYPFDELERAIRESCAHCRADLPGGKQSCCVECKAAYYCNRDCQVAHWKAGHKKDCVKNLKCWMRAEGKLEEEK